MGRAFVWLGRAWARALAAVGVVGATVHEGASRPPTAWSAAVCFAGLGPGEVTVDGAKVVGISQRRRRDGALFQCGALVRWAPGPLLDLLVLDDDQRTSAGEGLGGIAAGTGVEPDWLTSAFESALNGA